jgi:hypothetical protein
MPISAHSSSRVMKQRSGVLLMIWIQLEIEVEGSGDIRRDNECIERGRSRERKQKDPQQGGNDVQIAKHRHTDDPAAPWR